MSARQPEKQITAAELAAVPSTAPAPTPRGEADLGAPRRGEDVEAIVARAERLRAVSLPPEEETSERAERLAAAYARALQEQESAERIRRTQKNAPARTEEGYRVEQRVSSPPRMVVPRPVMYDQMTIRDPETGAPLVTPGWIGRWVRLDEVTQLGAVRRSAARLHNYLAWGAEVVRDSAGKIVDSIYGVAVQGPPEVFAARSARAAPTGVLHRQDLLAGVEAEVAALNRRMGEPMVHVKWEPEHGAETKAVGVDTYARRGE